MADSNFHARVRDDLLASFNRRERFVYHATVKWLVFRHGCRWWKPWARGYRNREGCR